MTNTQANMLPAPMEHAYDNVWEARAARREMLRQGEIVSTVTQDSRGLFVFDSYPELVAGGAHTPAPLSLGLCAECAEELDADTQAKPHGAFVENRDSLKAAQRYATEARHLRLEGRHTEARCALNYAGTLRRSALDSATRDEFWITQLKHRCDRKSRG